MDLYRTCGAALATFFVFSSTTVCAQSLGGAAAGSKENLDLPFDTSRTTAPDEPGLDVVEFYGTTLEGDGFFYLVDRSGTMQDRGELRLAKDEIIRNIREFSASTEFAVVFFDGGVEEFPRNGRPTPARPDVKAAAIRFVEAVPGGMRTCVKDGFAAILRLANRSTASRKRIVYVGDGGGTCCDETPEPIYLQVTLDLVAGLNQQRIRIDTIGVLMDSSRVIQERFLRNLARDNGGTYRCI